MLLTTQPAYGHFRPLLPLAHALDPGILGEQRPGAHVASYVSQRAVLERCAVVICHGGYGTLLDAVDAAVPLIVVPFGADQFINAATVERLGIGLVIDEESMTPQVTRAAVDRLVGEGSEHRQRIEALRDAWWALPGPADAADAVLELAH